MKSAITKLQEELAELRRGGAREDRLRLLEDAVLELDVRVRDLSESIARMSHRVALHSGEGLP